MNKSLFLIVLMLFLLLIPPLMIITKKGCQEEGIKRHPARFPQALPEFFINLCTEVGDLVLDPFAGSNMTGKVAETLGRNWLAF
jgi:DNA modification methylase